MFRPMRRFKQQLSDAECISILKSEVRGILSVLGDKIDSIKKHDKVSFCVMDKGTKDAESWFLHFRSVIVFGRIKIVEDHNKALDICRKLCYKFGLSPEVVEKMVKKSGAHVTCLELVPEHITGKAVKEE